MKVRRITVISLLIIALAILVGVPIRNILKM